MPHKKNIPTKQITDFLQSVRRNLDFSLDQDLKDREAFLFAALLDCERKLVDIIDDVVDADFTFFPEERKKKR